MHRAQGATVDAAHLFADGGGRDLAYVGMSRGRDSAHAWVVADDPAQATDDLRRDWSATRTPTWAIDTGRAVSGQARTEAITGDGRDNRVTAAALAHARTALNAKAVGGVTPSDLSPALSDAREALLRVEQARAGLDTGAGAYLDTEAGKAVVDLAHARAGLAEAQGTAEYAPRWRVRHAATKAAGRWAALEADASRRWQDHVAPEAERLDHQIAEQKVAVEALAARHDHRQVASAGLAADALGLRRGAARLAADLDACRDQLDGVRRRLRPQHSGSHLDPSGVPTPWQAPIDPSGALANL